MAKRASYFHSAENIRPIKKRKLIDEKANNNEIITNNELIESQKSIVGNFHNDVKLIDNEATINKILAFLATEVQSRKVFVPIVKEGNTILLGWVLEKYPNLINIVNKNGMNAFHHAVQSGKKEMANFLLKKSPNFLNSVDKYGNNAFHYAVAMGKIEMAESLFIKNE